MSNGTIDAYLDDCISAEDRMWSRGCSGPQWAQTCEVVSHKFECGLGILAKILARNGLGAKIIEVAKGNARECEGMESGQRHFMFDAPGVSAKRAMCMNIAAFQVERQCVV